MDYLDPMKYETKLLWDMTYYGKYWMMFPSNITIFVLQKIWVAIHDSLLGYQQ